MNFPQGPRPTILFKPNTTPSPEQQDIQSVSSWSCDHNSRVVKQRPPTTPPELPAATNAHTNQKFKCMTNVPLVIDAGNNQTTIESNRAMKPFITSPDVECSHTPLQQMMICPIRNPINKASCYWTSSNQKKRKYSLLQHGTNLPTGISFKTSTGTKTTVFTANSATVKIPNNFMPSIHHPNVLLYDLREKI